MAIHGAIGLFVASRFGPIAALAVVALGSALIIGRLQLSFDDRPIGALRRFFERLYYAYWAGLVGATLLFIPSVVAAAFGALDLTRAAPLCSLIGAAFGLYGVFYRAAHPIVRRLTIEVADLPAALEGFRVAQLSDVHVGSLYAEPELARLVARTNRLEVDLVALTGDYVTSGNRFHAVAARGLATLRAKEGVFAVMGNHDYAGDGEPLMRTFVEHGVRLLSNDAVRLQRGDAELIVAGLDDIYTRRADVDRMFAAVRALEAAPSAPVLVLAHDPRTFDRIAAHRPALVLSGHTHWGQVGVPFLATRYNVGRRLFRHAAGLYREGVTALYVHPGIGATGPPFRLGVAPEITVFELRKSVSLGQP